MKKLNIIIAVMSLTIVLTACNSNENNEIIIEESIDVVENQEVIEENIPDIKDNTNKKEETTYDENFSISDITDSANASTSDTSDIKIKQDDTDLFTGKIVDSAVDISIWELPEGIDNNQNYQVYDGNYNKFLFETNSYVIELSRNILLAKENVNNTDNIEYYVNKVNISLESLDIKNSIMMSNSVDDIELTNAWSSFYTEIKTIDLADLDNYDTKTLSEKVSNISIVIQNRLDGYDYFSDVYVDEESTSELIEVEQ